MKRTSKIRAAFCLGLVYAVACMLCTSLVTFTKASNDGTLEDNGRYLGDPLRGLNAGQLREFDEGFALFVKNWTIHEGIGPNINAHSCVACHRIPTPGGSGTGRETFVMRSASLIGTAGGSVFPRFEVRVDGSLHERSLPGPITFRKTQGLFGLGLLEAVPANVILEYSDPNDANGDGISGRLVKTGQSFGRFGWKGDAPTIEAFVEEAFAVEMGLGRAHTADAKRIEVNDAQIRLVSQFIRFLGAPRPIGGNNFAKGKELFDRIGCALCHRPSLTTGPAEAPLGNQTLFAFTDLLLHDMGARLSDGIQENGVLAQEFRTPPLWGIASTGPPYLHDGRANSVYEAIIAHGGEAGSAAAKFQVLSDEEKQAVLRFINSL